MAIKVSGTTVIDDSRNIQNVGVVTASSFVGSLTGTASTATAAGTAYAIAGSPNLNVGVVTATNMVAGTTLSVGTGSAATSNVDLDVSGSYAGNITSISTNVDCSTGNYFTATVNGTTTFSVSNVPSSRAYSFVLQVTHTSGTINWFSGVVWPGGTAPTLNTSKTHLFIFVTSNGGTTWRGSSLVDYAS